MEELTELTIDIPTPLPPTIRDEHAFLKHFGLI